MPVTQTGFSELTAIQKKILRPIDVFMQSPPQSKYQISRPCQ